MSYQVPGFALGIEMLEDVFISSGPKSALPCVAH